MSFEKAQIVRSLRGHDSGELFCVMDVESGWLLLADGKRRRVNKPKRKNEKHVVLAGGGNTPPLKKSGWASLSATVSCARRWQPFETKWRYDALAKDDMIELEGVVTEALPNTTFNVDIGNGDIILALISGKLRMNFIRILPGDKVTVQMSPYDLTRGRSTWRSK